MNEKLDYTMTVPKEIQEMAMKIDDWFLQQGIHEWALMNICSRDYINKLESLQLEVQHIKELIK